jgi:signal transduction histidine kinase
MRFDSKRAWTALEKAFHALGEELPKETPGAAIATIVTWLQRSVRNPRRRMSGENRLRDEILCELYYHTGRIAFTSGKPGRLILSSVRALEPGERLGVSPALAKSYLTYSFVLTVLGLKALGTRYFDVAETMARQIVDPVVYAHVLQVQAIIAAWDGRMGDAVDIGSRCLLEYGNWRELNEFSLLAWTLYQIETVRGRDAEAWRWLDLPIQRVNRHEGQPVVDEFLLLAARGALVGLGRDAEASLLLRRLEQVTVPIPLDSATYVSTFGPRIRAFTEKADLGSDFETACHAFKSLGQEARRAHLNVFEYYLHIAHARVHACLRAEPTVRDEVLAALGPAVDDLEAAARKIPLFRAHATALRGYEHFFNARYEQASEAFARAEEVAVTENAPWVLYAVHRGRAHMLKEKGDEDAARDQALLAESIARQHSSVPRAKWIREEFDLRIRHVAGGLDELLTMSGERQLLSEDTASAVPGVSHARRQLRALLRISKARAQELDPDLQARLVVDELIQALRAERGLLLLTPAVTPVGVSANDVPSLEVIVARDVSGRDLMNCSDYDQATVHGATEIAAESGAESAAPFCVGLTSLRSTMAAPIVVEDTTAGIVYVDRVLGEGVFTEADGEVLSALAGQVSVALELTRALRERERAEESLRAAEKMEAVARLARGIGHDVNNMLSAVSLTTEAMAQTPGAEGLVGDDIRAIQSVLRGAGDLVRKLRDIAQGEFGHPELIQLSERVERLRPIMGGLLGAGISIETKFDSRAGILIDAGQFDQILTNLVINARDAMPEGGRLTIEVQEVLLDEIYTREHPRVTVGKYVRLSVADTGQGMDAHVRDKIFEPYFTTKSERGGTGIGLSTVYWIVSRSGGHIDVVSSTGNGTIFSLYFPVPEHPPLNRERETVSESSGLRRNRQARNGHRPASLK